MKLNKSRLKQFNYQIVLIPAATAALVSLLVVKCFMTSDRDTLLRYVKKETAYERVMRTRTIRCGYMVSSPWMARNGETGELSGLYHDYMAQIGKILNLKIEYADELDVMQYAAALEKDKIDAMCTGVAVLVNRGGKRSDFIDPLYYSPSHVFIRANDTRFGQDILAGNDPKFTLMYIEGTLTAQLHNQFFPKAQSVELPRVIRAPELLENLAAGEGDFIVSDVYNFGEFNAKSPGKIKMVSDRPLTITPRAIAIKSGESELRMMLNYATLQLQFSGVMDQILDEYEKYSGMYYRMSLPYRLKTK